MAEENRTACVWLPRAGLHLARARSSAAVCRRCRSEKTGSTSAARLPVCLGNESAQNGRGNPKVRRYLEGKFPVKKAIITLLQLAVTVALLYWVFHDPEQRAKMAKALHEADYRWVLAAIVAYVIVEIAAAVRWQILLRVQGIGIKFFRLAGLFFIGMFYNQFLPGGTGGDIIKSYLLLKETPDHKAGALLAVVFDRLVGLVALGVITVTLGALRFDLLWRTPVTVESGLTPRQLLGTLGIMLGFSIAGLITSFIISGFNLFHLLPHKFPGRDKLIEISAAYHLYARHWIATFVAFGVSVIAHLATFMTFLFVAYALRAEDVRKEPP